MGLFTIVCFLLFIYSRKFKANVKCDICGEVSHVTRDCPFKNDKVYQNKPREYKNVEEEFARFVEDAEGSTGRAMKLIDLATN